MMYRIASPPVPPPRRKTHINLQAHARRSSLWASPSLAIITVTFFLPMTKACDDVVSPMSQAAESVGAFVWIVPTFLSAALLALALVKSLDGNPATRFAFVCVGTLVGTLLVVAVDCLGDKGAFIVPAYGFTALAAIALMVRSRRHYAWRSLSLLVDAYTVAALPLAAVVFAAAEYYGAFIFMFAYTALVAQRITLAVHTRWLLREARSHLADVEERHDRLGRVQRLAPAEHQTATR